MGTVELRMLFSVLDFCSRYLRPLPRRLPIVMNLSDADYRTQPVHWAVNSTSLATVGDEEAETGSAGWYSLFGGRQVCSNCRSSQGPTADSLDSTRLQKVSKKVIIPLDDVSGIAEGRSLH